MIFLQDLAQLMGVTSQASDQAKEKAATAAAEFKALSLEDLINRLAHTLVDFAIHLAIAILVFYVGRFIIRRLYLVVNNILVLRHVDKSLSTFILSLIRMVLYFILVVTVIGILGINTSSFIAIFASAGVAIGMALSGTLQNFAGGVLILMLKPYKVGDYIEAQGYAGTVTEIQIFSTVICTYDNKSIIIPNGGLSTSSINNWSREDYRRVDWSISISYGDSFENARRAILDILLADPRVVRTTLAADMETRAEMRREVTTQTDTPPEQTRKPRTFLGRLFHRHRRRIAEMDSTDLSKLNPVADSKLKLDRAPSVVLSQMADSSINLTVRAWTPSESYWSLLYDMYENFYTILPTKGVNFPFPQLDVHLTTTAPQP